jgi:hypothetical protein
LTTPLSKATSIPTERLALNKDKLTVYIVSVHNCQFLRPMDFAEEEADDMEDGEEDEQERRRSRSRKNRSDESSSDMNDDIAVTIKSLKRASRQAQQQQRWTAHEQHVIRLADSAYYDNYYIAGVNSSNLSGATPGDAKERVSGGGNTDSSGAHSHSPAYCVIRAPFSIVKLTTHGLDTWCYNWHAGVFDKLTKQLKNLINWQTLRSHLLDRILIQKLGISETCAGAFLHLLLLLLFYYHFYYYYFIFVLFLTILCMLFNSFIYS